MAANSPDSQVTISIGSLISSFKNPLADHNLSMPPKASIFEVPKILHRHNPQAYEPNAFSIGPFRYGQEKLKPTEKIKWKYLQGLLRRSGKSEELMLEQLFRAVTAIVKEARQCYAGSSIGTCTDEEFVKILVLDGCFIIELFLKDAEEPINDFDDPIYSMNVLLEFLKQDLILLENQIPWPVLELLFDMTMVSQTKTLIELALNFFGYMFSSHRPSIEPKMFPNDEIKHILDLLRLSLILPLYPSNRDATGWQPIPCARKIKVSGIKLKRVSSNSILDIRFDNGSLEIPPLLLRETTEPIFRNLISLEQCLPNCPPIITAYAKLMDNLVDKIEDVELLCENDVLDNWLHATDATQFFNNLYNDAYLKTFYYGGVCQEVNNYSKKWWPKWRNFYYTQSYSTTPWVIVSQIVAVIFFILNFLQTFFTIASYLSQKGESSQN
ncbi:hypothetical protein Q3G72_027512 [Acer saccharum]|nr:hypothetical protein Q3G72_027512 [Acer saccharum]